MDVLVVTALSLGARVKSNGVRVLFSWKLFLLKAARSVHLAPPAHKPCFSGIVYHV